MEKGFARIAKQYNMTVPEVKGYFKSRDDMLPFINELLNEKILKFLRDEAKYIKAAGAPQTEEKKTPEAGDQEAGNKTDNKQSTGE